MANVNVSCVFFPYNFIFHLASFIVYPQCTRSLSNALRLGIKKSGYLSIVLTINL